MPSQVIKVLVETGQKVNAGDALIILSSMKMENTIEAITAGNVAEIYVNEGDNIAADAPLLSVHPIETTS